MTKVGTPWLSVVMPTYNGEAYLEVAFQSLLAQECDDMEVILVDDGSTDRTKEIIESFQTRLGLQKTYREHAGNWVANTNCGVRQARGEYVSILHQDDFWLETRVSILRELSKRFPDAVLFLHPSWFVDSRGRKIGKWSCPLPGDLGRLAPELVFPRLLVQNFISMPAPLIKRDALLQIGGMDESLWFTPDWKCWLSLSRVGHWVYYGEPLSCFRIHSQSQTMLGSKTPQQYRNQYEKVQKEFFPVLEQMPVSRRLFEEIARVSTDINVALLASTLQQSTGLGRLLLRVVMLGPTGWLKLLKYSRLHERIISRVRAKLAVTRQDTATL